MDALPASYVSLSRDIIAALEAAEKIGTDQPTLEAAI
jgi:hypothetical protein